MANSENTSLQSLNWAALRDLEAVVAVLVIVKQSLLPFTQLYAGPISTLSAMILATVLLRRRGSSWVDLGIRDVDSIMPTGLTRTEFFAGRNHIRQCA